MQDNILNKINISTRILILMFCCLILLIVKSIYLVYFMIILVIVLMILSNKSVKEYINIIKNTQSWLIFILVVYIIFSRNIIGTFYLLLRLELIVLYISVFILTINFQKLTIGIKTIFSSLKIINMEKFSYNVVLFIYFINFYLTSKKEIFDKYTNEKKIIYIFSLKYNVIPRLFLSIFKVNKLESSLKLKFLSTKKEEQNKISNIVLTIFILLFIIVFFKEVIL